MADLLPFRKAQLDDIVGKLDAQGASSDQIQQIVGDFKSKYALPGVAAPVPAALQPGTKNPNDPFENRPPEEEVFGISSIMRGIRDATLRGQVGQGLNEAGLGALQGVGMTVGIPAGLGAIGKAAMAAKALNFRPLAGLGVGAATAYGTDKALEAIDLPWYLRLPASLFLGRKAGGAIDPSVAEKLTYKAIRSYLAGKDPEDIPLFKINPNISRRYNQSGGGPYVAERPPDLPKPSRGSGPSVDQPSLMEDPEIFTKRVKIAASGHDPYNPEQAASSGGGTSTPSQREPDWVVKARKKAIEDEAARIAKAQSVRNR